MSTDAHRTTPDDATREQGKREAQAAHEPDRAPTPEEEQAAEKLSVDPEVAETFKDAAERGADAQGEGRIEP